jgi:hypothetical protein
MQDSTAYAFIGGGIVEWKARWLRKSDVTSIWNVWDAIGSNAIHGLKTNISQLT